MDTKIIYCETCGEPLDLTKAHDGICKCQYCSSVSILPKEETSKSTKMLLEIGEHELDVSNFDDAIEAYQKAIEKDSQEPEAF